MLHTYHQMDALTWACEVSFLTGCVHWSYTCSPDLLSILPLGGDSPTVHLPSLSFSCYDCHSKSSSYWGHGVTWLVGSIICHDASHLPVPPLEKIPGISLALVSGNSKNQRLWCFLFNSKGTFLPFSNLTTLVWSLSMDQMGLKINYIFGGGMTYIGHVRWSQILR